jgi:hypothetical protein
VFRKSSFSDADLNAKLAGDNLKIKLSPAVLDGGRLNAAAEVRSIIQASGYRLEHEHA